MTITHEDETFSRIEVTSIYDDRFESRIEYWFCGSGVVPKFDPRRDL